MCGNTPQEVVSHIANPMFGRGDEYERLLTAVLDVRQIKIEDRHTFLIELYETVYGLKNHVGSKDPLGISAYNPNLDPEVIDPIRKHLEEFADLKLNELFGIDLPTYLNQPPHVLRNIRKAAANIRMMEKKAVNQLNETLKEANNE